MIALDTNILVYAHREDSPFFEPADACIAQLAEGPTVWGIPWPCIHEFYSVVTNARVFKPASKPDRAMEQIDNWLESPSLRLLGESAQHWSSLRELLSEGKAVGGMVHDARIAAICLQHGVREFWTADRDFSRFPRLNCRNPLIH